MKVKLSAEQIARLIDISAVQAESTKEEVEDIIDKAIKYNFICVFSMPSLISMVVDRVSDYPEVNAGGVVGFPSGGETTSVKVYQAQELKALGCTEIDMVINIGKLKSGLYDEVLSDIKAVKDAVQPLPLKVIIEVALLTDMEIRQASLLILEAGADFVKTGTGWQGATTTHHIKLIKDTVGDSIKLKVAGGVRSLDTLLEMYEMGVCRFGIGRKSALNIMEDAQRRDQQQ